MGYHTNPWMVEENKDLLASILLAITNESSVDFKVAPGLNISTEQYRLRRILAATDYHPDACGGVFAELGSKCTIRVLFKESILKVVPRTTARAQRPAKLDLTEVVPNEVDMLSRVRSPEHTENITILSFEPSPTYNVDEFEQALSDAGWTLHRSTISLANGRISAAVERNASDEPAGFDILERSK